MREQAPLQVYHEIIERIGEAMADNGIAEITIGNVKVSRALDNMEDLQNA